MRLYWPLAVLALLAGCASAPSRPPVTLERVVELTRQGTPPEQIVAEMRDAGTVYRLSGSQLARLRDQGVADQVLDYMQDTYLSEMEQRGRMYSYDPYWWGPYGGPYPYWAWGGPYPYYWGGGYYHPYRHYNHGRGSWGHSVGGSGAGAGGGSAGGGGPGNPPSPLGTRNGIGSTGPNPGSPSSPPIQFGRPR